MTYLNKIQSGFIRSFLFMPASNARALEKAKTLACDGLIFDLEDSVFEGDRPLAHENLTRLVKGEDFGKRKTLIRTSATDSTCFAADLKIANMCRPDGIVLPKISTAEQLLVAEKQIENGINIWAMIESPLALMNLKEICTATDRLAGIIVGPNDLAKETGTKMDRAIMHPWLMMAVAAARAYNLSVLDGVYNNFRDLEGLEKECTQGAAMGFDGKTLIHPSQIENANNAFGPQPEEIARAHAIIKAFDEPQNATKGAIQINGEMVERLHLDSAIKLISLIEQNN